MISFKKLSTISNIYTEIGICNHKKVSVIVIINRHTTWFRVELAALLASLAASEHRSLAFDYTLSPFCMTVQ